MPVSESKRQRVLVASSVLYSEVTIFFTGEREYDLHFRNIPVFHVIFSD
jgi:hypothetical protein